MIDHSHTKAPNTRTIQEMRMAKILIVDDSSDTRGEIVEYFRSQGIDVDWAVDGQDGLTKIQQDPELKLVLCDVNMPNMDGITMLEKLRESGNLVTVIMLTTEEKPEMREKGRALQVRGWIVKPFNGSSIINAVRKMIE